MPPVQSPHVPLHLLENILKAPPHSRSCGYFQPIKKVGMAEMSFSETVHSQYRRCCHGNLLLFTPCNYAEEMNFTSANYQQQKKQTHTGHMVFRKLVRSKVAYHVLTSMNGCCGSIRGRNYTVASFNASIQHRSPRCVHSVCSQLQRLRTVTVASPSALGAVDALRLRISQGGHEVERAF
ncbi:hypothetical protein IRJ41_001247 [Triplophysa rosa]|uniref:Uncharacterized protein n=1 Tax=Triplophysa rosa TaxID=992332 RepID=A0A9W7WPY3_TRIRA|nr:hypothetical protein IRJ41_001247 [Triplophysa rosa]